MKGRLHAYVSGTVQGVGFRFATERAASALGLTGFVRNLPDGRVEIVAEGGDRELGDLISRLRGIFGGYIRDIDVRQEKPVGEFDGFDVAG